MKIKILLAVVILLVPLLFLGCMFSPPTTTPTTPATTPQAEINTKFTQDIATINSNIASINTKNSEQDNKISALENNTSTDAYSKSEIDSKLNNFISNLSADQVTQLKTKLGITSTSTSTSTPTGQIEYSIVNLQTYYQFSTSSNYPVQIRIFNNKSDARYVRLQLTSSTFSNASTGGFNSPAVAITTNSNSMGQAPCTYTVNAVGNSVLLISSGGGTNSQGEYLLSSGQQMDIWITLTIYPINSVLWNLTVSGSDRPIS